MVTLILGRASRDAHYDNITHPSSSTSRCYPASPLSNRTTLYSLRSKKCVQRLYIGTRKNHGLCCAKTLYDYEYRRGKREWNPRETCRSGTSREKWQSGARRPATSLAQSRVAGSVFDRPHWRNIIVFESLEGTVG